eukprot:CAMPEP_0172483342 /NCGR_PEP_ID=MMETSP1066-20121228/10309_1 /TAXON_ID=671091 /ORGANISM="Coscinodiscus wailesii, Strain CCMP2513" /LENGTH=557 /DNA_ID=CAMNT_0013247161 /DNA_START=48 /DNA_END=1721 /DNA_ORIENTATION=+
MVRTRRQPQSKLDATTTTTTTTVTAQENNDNVKYDEAYASHFQKDGMSYQEYIDAKRARNREMLMSSGLLDAVANAREMAILAKKKTTTTATTPRTKRRREDKSAAPRARRKSSRIAGIKAEDRYVVQERNGEFTVAGDASDVKEEEPVGFYAGRVNDGSDLSLVEAVKLSEAKWHTDDTPQQTESFLRGVVSSFPPDKDSGGSCSGGGGISADDIMNQIASLSITNPETDVAKVTPERIYSITSHPHTILACAGDKTGHIGFWNPSPTADGGTTTPHNVRAHSSCVNYLEWNRSGSHLFSASYDGTVRRFDARAETFEQVFGTYDDDAAFKGRLGYDCDDGGYMQYACLDKRSEEAFFASTSRGRVMHVDLRRPVVSCFEMSAKKINSVSQHPVDRHIIATAGLDETVKLFDLRLTKKALGQQVCARSVNSAFFSPSGTYLLATTMADTLTVVKDGHLKSGTMKPDRVIRHDNRTGRWLTTFMAQWHPLHDIFVIGSMARPRRIEIFDPVKGLLRGVSGEGLSSVCSRCCFWKNEERMVVLGGNSSGRVSIIRTMS